MELKVTFQGEIKEVSADAGGMSKEWFTIICLDILKPERCKIDFIIRSF